MREVTAGQAATAKCRRYRQAGRACADHDNVSAHDRALYDDSAAVTIAAMAPGRIGPTSEGAGDRWTWAQVCARRAERHRLIVPAQSEPAEVASVLEDEFLARGVRLLKGARAMGISRTEGGVHVDCDDGRLGGRYDGSGR